MAPMNLNAQRTASLAQPGVNHGDYFGDPEETRGLRNNNPGNIEMVTRDPVRSGLHAEFGRLGSDGRFAVYSTPMGGIAANFEVLNDMQTRRGLNTIAGIVSAWAPPNENNTKAYIAAVSKATGIGPNDKLPNFFSRPDVAASILAGKYAVENGINPYDKSTISAGVEMARDALSRNFSKMDSISERGAMARNMEEQRQAFRGPTDYGAPVWDGTTEQAPTLAAPVGAVSFGGALPDPTVPNDLMKAYDYTAPGPDLGANLNVAPPGFSLPGWNGWESLRTSDNVEVAPPSPEFGPFIPDIYGMPGYYDDRKSITQEIEKNGLPTSDTIETDKGYIPGMDMNLSGQLNYGPYDFSSIPSAGTYASVDGVERPSIDQAFTGATPVASDVSPGAFSQREMGSMGVNPGFGAGITPGVSPAVDLGYAPSIDAGSLGTWGGFGAGIDTAAPSAAAPTRDVSMGYQPDFGQNMGSMGVNPGFGGGITPNAMPSIDMGFGIAPVGPAKTQDTYVDRPGLTGIDLSTYNGAFGLGGIALTGPGTTATNVLGLDGITPTAPARPNTAAATPPELPGFTLPPEVVPPTTVTPAPAPRTAAPALAAPTPVRSYSVRDVGTPAREQQQPTAAPAPMTPEAYLGSVMNGASTANIGGKDYSGLGQMARNMDQYAQPAMLGLERAYADATGQQGPKGLFDGLFGGTPSTSTPTAGWGSMPDIGGLFTGQNIGRVGGALAGGALAGPIGALGGGLLGNFVGGWLGGSGNQGPSDGLGQVRDALTGQVLGGYDPSDPKNNGWAGWGEGWSSGGNTPGAGGLY